MTEIKTQIEFDFEQPSTAVFEFECKGHCTHDVCVSVSALVSTLVQIVKDTEARLEELEIVYEYGDVKIKCVCERMVFELKLRQKIEAIMTGLEMFKENYRDEIEIKNGGVVFKNSEIL